VAEKPARRRLFEISMLEETKISLKKAHVTRTR
jgi:hypothetical protein